MPLGLALHFLAMGASHCFLNAFRPTLPLEFPFDPDAGLVAAAAVFPVHAGFDLSIDPAAGPLQEADASRVDWCSELPFDPVA